jgi:ABC-type Na+ efflux pump permease subunit
MRVAPPNHFAVFRPLQPLFSPSVASIYADWHFPTFAVTVAIFAVFSIECFVFVADICSIYKTKIKIIY